MAKEGRCFHLKVKVKGQSIVFETKTDQPVKALLVIGDRHWPDPSGVDVHIRSGNLSCDENQPPRREEQQILSMQSPCLCSKSDNTDSNT